MMRITEVLSKGKLTNISILDLPAFGSKIAHLEWQHRRISNWPSEVSFSILDEMNVPKQTVFEIRRRRRMFKGEALERIGPPLLLRSSRSHSLVVSQSLTLSHHQLKWTAINYSGW
jgi:hypothetical protein